MSSYLLGDASGLCDLGICGWCEWLEGGYGEKHAYVTARIWAASCEAIKTAVSCIVALQSRSARCLCTNLAQYKSARGTQ